jgi:hypothetical protein
MKNLSLFLFLAFTFSLHSFSQEIKGKDTITMTGSGLGGIRFYQHGENLNMATLTEIIKPNPEAYTYLNKAKTNNAFSLIFSAIGSFAIGWELVAASAWAGGEAVWFNGLSD